MLIIGKDCDGVYSPIMDYSMALLILAMAKKLKWKRAHVDTKTAFLNGLVNLETFIKNVHNHLK